MSLVLLVGAAAGVGALVRRNFTVFFRKHVSQRNAFIATMFINIVGSFFIGILAGLFLPNTVNYRILAIGLLGGLTTFSSFNSELVNLTLAGRTKVALAYMGGSYLLGLTFVFLGHLVATMAV